MKPLFADFGRRFKPVTDVKTLLSRCFQWVRKATSVLIRQAIVVYCAGTDSRLKRPVRYLAIAVAAYAFSPIDLIPDFIPVLGLLDDLIIVPAGVWLVLHLAPDVVVSAARQRADELLEKPISLLAGVFIVLIWLFVICVLLLLLW